MIPTIGVMIGIYILLRCCDLLASAPGRFSSSGARVVVMVAALLCFLMTLFCIADLALTSAGRTTTGAAVVPESMEQMQLRSLTAEQRREIDAQRRREIDDLIRRRQESQR